MTRPVLLVVPMADEFRDADEERSFHAHLAHFDRDAHVVVDGVRFAFAQDDLRAIAMDVRYHIYVPSGLNSAVYSRVVTFAKVKFRPRLARAQILDLCAATLRTTVDDVERSLAWTANYMAFHDGGDPEAEHPYPPSEP
ncbi:MAG: hypothetical protein JNK45_19585 [Myxococcales bacterium]|nr:hypothetical protein [Myxococcales bacterium]